MNKFLNPGLVEQFISATGSKIFTVTFVKKDGSRRVMNARRGVHKNLKGNAPKTKNSSVITVYDMQLKDYRSVSLSRVISVVSQKAKLSVTTTTKKKTNAKPSNTTKTALTAFLNKPVTLGNAPSTFTSTNPSAVSFKV